MKNDIRLFEKIRKRSNNNINNNELVLGIILLAFGLIILLNQVEFISILPIIIGMWLIIKSVMKFQLAINLKSMMAEKWGWVLASAILMFIFGVLIVLNPFATVITLTRFIGIMLLIAEICDLIESIYILTKVK